MLEEYNLPAPVAALRSLLFHVNTTCAMRNCPLSYGMPIALWFLVSNVTFTSETNLRLTFHVYVPTMLLKFMACPTKQKKLASSAGCSMITQKTHRENTNNARLSTQTNRTPTNSRNDTKQEPARRQRAQRPSILIYMKKMSVANTLIET